MINLRTRLIIFGLAYFAFVGSATAKSLVIGRVSSDASQTHKQLKPMVDYVANRLADIGITDGQVSMAKNHDEMLRYLREGKVDWVPKTVFEALIYNREVSAEIALRSWRQAVPNYHTVMFARKDGQIASLKDLVGKKIAFEDPGSTCDFLFRLRSSNGQIFNCWNYPHREKNSWRAVSVTRKKIQEPEERSEGH